MPPPDIDALSPAELKSLAHAASRAAASGEAEASQE